jgi:hypothetical protein
MNPSIIEKQRGLGCESNSRNEFCTVGRIMCNRMPMALPTLAMPCPLGQYMRMELWSMSELFV